MGRLSVLSARHPNASLRLQILPLVIILINDFFELLNLAALIGTSLNKMLTGGVLGLDELISFV